MAVTGGSSVIQNEDYNGLRSTVSGIYATSWGQAMRSVAVVGGSTPGVSDTIQSEQYLALYLDLQSVHVHQTATASTAIAVPADGYTVGADTSFNFNLSSGAKTSVTGGTLMGFNDYEGVVTTVSNYNPTHRGWPPGNFIPGTPVSSTRTTTWGASTPTAIYHIVTVTFSSQAQRNYFFNAGGQITFACSATNIGTGASQNKNQDWANLLSAMGTVYFDAFSTSGSSGTSAGIGHSALTTTYQTLLTKTGSGAYSDNYYKIEGRVASTTQLRFRITIDDGDTGTGNLGGPGTGTPIDEPVTADFTSTVTPLRPNSSFVYNTITYTACDLAAPTLASAYDLSSNPTSAPA